MKTDPKIAAIYAEALADLAEAAGSAKEMEQEVFDLSAALQQDTAVWKFFESPVMPVEDKLSVITSTLKSQVSELMFRFLGVLAARKRMDHLPVIASAYRDIMDKKLNRRRVKLSSAEELAAAERELISDAMQKFLKAEIVLEVERDESLIGGMVLRSGDMLVDTSLKSALARIKSKLLNTKTIGEEYYEN